MLHTLIANAYPLVAFFAVVEGPGMAIAVGVAFALGYISPYYAYAILMGGAFVQDCVYYWLGRWAARVKTVRDWASRVRLVRSNVLAIESSWRRDMILTLLLSKFAYGLYAPFVVTAGTSRIGFGKFLLASMALSAPVLALWIAVGYGFAKLYGASGHYAAYVCGGAGVVALVAMYFMMRHARRKLNPKKAAKESRLIEAGKGETKPVR